MTKFFFIGIGGFFGSVGRFLLAEIFQNFSKGSGFPWGTLGVNLIGCFVIGVLGAFFALERLHPNYRLFFIVGALGGFTTFSSFSFETLHLLRRKELLQAFLYVTASTGIGLTLTGIGFFLGEKISTRWF